MPATHALPNVTLMIEEGYGASGFSNEFAARRVSRGLLWDGRSVGPFSSLVSRGPGLGLDWRINDSTRLDFAGRYGRDYFGHGQAQVASLGITRQVGVGAKLGARYGVLRENSALLGIQGSGAFNGLTGSSTHFLDVSMEKQVSRRTTLFGSFSQGATGGGPGLGNTLISSWSGLRAQALSFGIEATNVWRSSDRLTVTASSPLHTSTGLVNIRVPVREISDGQVAYENHGVSVAPAGREKRVEFVYEADAAENASLSLDGYILDEPNNAAAADADVGVAVKMQLRF